MLKMKRHCEKCGGATDLTQAAYICSYECTFCPPCAEAMNRVCPNCQGNLVLRPTRTKSPVQVLTSSRYTSFAEFYPFYLSEHANPVSRRLHVLGTSIALVLLVAALVLRKGWLVPVALVQGYAFAWVGHFCFEHNKPATFKYPLYSFLGDWRMWFETLTGKLPAPPSPPRPQ